MTINKSLSTSTLGNELFLSAKESNHSPSNDKNLKPKPRSLYNSETKTHGQEAINYAKNSYLAGKAFLSPFMKRVLDIIKSNQHVESFSVNDISRILNLSKMQVYRRVKKATGNPPVKLIRKIRLEKAKLLLKNSEFSIGEISYRVGFGDPNYFSRAFTKEFGNSPRKERNILQRMS